MARLIWAEPALLDLDEIAEYIALDDPKAASRLVKKIFSRVERLKAHPNSGKRPPELKRTPYREVVVPPCRIFCRFDDDRVYVLFVVRSEQLLREHLIERQKLE